MSHRKFVSETNITFKSIHYIKTNILAMKIVVAPQVRKELNIVLSLREIVLAKNVTKIIEKARYSPDTAPCDFFSIFEAKIETLKKAL